MLAIKDQLDSQSFVSVVKRVLPQAFSPERFVKIALVAISKTPLLQKCTVPSLMQSITESAELGLEIGGALGHAYLVPYWSGKLGAYEAKFMPGYRGLIKLAWDSIKATVQARVVFRDDKFDYRLGTTVEIMHKPSPGSSRRQPTDVTFAYAVGTGRDFGTLCEVMSRDEIEAIRLRSKSKDDGPWVTDWCEMARKTAVRRLMKYLPVSAGSALAKAVAADDEAVGIIDVDAIATMAVDEPEQTTNPTARTERLAEKLAADDSAQPKPKEAVDEHREVKTPLPPAMTGDPSKSTPEELAEATGTPLFDPNARGKTSRNPADFRR